MRELVNRLTRLFMLRRNNRQSMKQERPSTHMSKRHGTTRARASQEAGINARRPRVEPQVEAQILDIAFRCPSHGQDRVSRDLRTLKSNVSASGVRYVWQRHNLETLDKRIAWIETRLGRNDALWSEEQLAARDRVRSGRQARALGASMVGQNAGEVPRSMHILAVAARLLRGRGYEATALRDIALMAHIPLGSIYYHFPTKEELFAAVYEEGIARLLGSLHQAMGSATDPWERLEIACATHLENLCGGDDFMTVPVPTRLPQLSSSVRRRVVQLSDQYERTFRDLIDRLPTDPALSKSLLRLQILGALNWTIVWYQPDKSTPKEIASQLVRAFRWGVEPSRARRRAAA